MELVKPGNANVALARHFGIETFDHLVSEFDHEQRQK
jgi:hypothetical protein